MSDGRQRIVRAIALYLPQYHPIPENDEWWGKGFTEWTHVARARPLFRGHMQPKFPADLGYYDLRVPETRIAQAELAREYGIEGFCYWHYWFAGRRLLERPFEEVLKSGKPVFPFCLAWANHSWNAAWIGLPEKVFLEQTYPGKEDYIAHFNNLLPAFTDSRYITVDGKPLFIIFRPSYIPEPKEFTDLWRSLAERNGLKGLFMLGMCCSPWNKSPWHPEDYGLDGAITIPGQSPESRFGEKHDKLVNKRTLKERVRLLLKRPCIRKYRDLVRHAFEPKPLPLNIYPAALTNWDSTPRHGIRGTVLTGCSPEAFRNHLQDAVSCVLDRDFDHRLVLLKSWNEWAEGNYLEPDLGFGHGWLEAVRSVVCTS
ncbi:MAG: glycosyltransferase WbsX family protein [Armatimonadota bacterium]